MRSLETATSAASAAPIPDGKSLAVECESAGLLTLARALDGLVAQPDVLNALRAAYVAAEVEAAATWA